MTFLPLHVLLLSNLVWLPGFLLENHPVTYTNYSSTSSTSLTMNLEGACPPKFTK